MKKIFSVLTLASALSLCSPAVAGGPLQADVLKASMARACASADRALLGFGGACSLTPFERRPLTARVAEYSAVVRVGPGEHDVIGVHRVVREKAPYEPVHASKAIMMAHGDAWGFDAGFLAGGAHSAPVYLADSGVDVWGIDFRWTLVPASTTDFSFMQHWGIERDVSDLWVALSVARAARFFTAGDLNKLTLLGWSRGGEAGYAYMNDETQVPAPLRHVSGFIPVDIYVKTDDPALRAAACERCALGQAQLAGGVYQDSTGLLVSTAGALASADPGGSSPLFPGASNATAGLLIGTSSYLLMGAYPIAPSYHLAGGVFDNSGQPVDLAFSDKALWYQTEAAAAPYEPVLVKVEGDGVQCDDPSVINVPFDDHLAQITAPVLYMGAHGGMGEYGVYTTTLLGSADVTVHVVSTLPPEQRALDIGHSDIWLGDDADVLYWQPMLSWIQAH